MTTLSILDLSDPDAVTEFERKRIEVIRAMKEKNIQHITVRGQQVRNEKERRAK